MRRRPKLLKQSTEQVKEGEIAASMSDDQLIAALTSEVGIPVGAGEDQEGEGERASCVYLCREFVACVVACAVRVLWWCAVACVVGILSSVLVPFKSTQSRRGALRLRQRYVPRTCRTLLASVCTYFPT